jgi:hypothetical protein
MGMKPAVILLLLSLGLGLSTLSVVAQAAPSVPQSPEITFYSSSDLVLVDVVALNANNGLSDKMLKRDDFQIFDNGHPVSIKTFDSGAIFNSPPRTLVRCAMLHARLRGEGFGFVSRTNQSFQARSEVPGKTRYGGSRSLVRRW